MKKHLSLALIVALLLTLVACGTPAPIPNPPLVLGEKYLADLDYEQALLQFDQAIEIDPKNPRGYLGKVDALLQLDRQDDAVVVLGDGAKAVSRDQRGDMKFVQEEIGKSPEDGFVGVATTYEKFGWADLALSILDRAAKKFPTMQRVITAWRELAERLGIEIESEYLVFDIGMTWHEAKAYCESIGGHLATITSQDEQNCIEALLEGHTKNIYWLGATDEAQEGQWEWITGEPFEYANWNYEAPNNSGGIEHYLHIYRISFLDNLAYKWNDLAARINDGGFWSNENSGFICEWEPGTRGNIEAISSDATNFNGNAYKVYDMGMTWYEAKAYCENLGGHLATITSQAEQDFIEGLIENHDRNIYWLGGTDEAYEGQWEWVTGEPFEYKNWDYGEPNNVNENEHYLHIFRIPCPYLDGMSLAGKWNDLQYDAYQLLEDDYFYSLDTAGFICEWSSISNGGEQS